MKLTSTLTRLMAAGSILAIAGFADAQHKQSDSEIRQQLTIGGAPALPDAGTPRPNPNASPYPITAREYAAMMIDRTIVETTDEPFDLQSGMGVVGSCLCFWDNGRFDHWNGQGSAEGAAFTARCADDFFLPECSVYRLDEISAVMLVDSPNAAPAAFLEIYADCNGRPTGEPIGTFEMSSAQLLGNFIGGLEIWEFSFDTSDCNLRGGCTYWASPVGIGDGSGEDVYYFATAGNLVQGNEAPIPAIAPVQLNQGHFTNPWGFVPYTDWTPVEVTNVKKHDFAFAVCATECELLWDNGQADFSRYLNKAVSANLPHFRAADNFALAPCTDWTLCMIELCVLTSCECATVSLEIYESDPITMLPTGTPVFTATDPKVFDLNYAQADNTGVTVQAKRLQFGAQLDLNATLTGGKTYWVSIVEGGTLTGTDRLYFCYAYKCKKPADCQIGITEAAFYKPVFAEWRPYSQFVSNGAEPNELAFSVYGKTEVTGSTEEPTPHDVPRIYAGEAPDRRNTGANMNRTGPSGAGGQ
ncbi:MAG: hypothetical protein R3B46_07615 [Phycisphaerales bacterium]